MVLSFSRAPTITSSVVGSYGKQENCRLHPQALDLANAGQGGLDHPVLAAVLFQRLYQVIRLVREIVGRGAELLGLLDQARDVLLRPLRLEVLRLAASGLA